MEKGRGTGQLEILSPPSNIHISSQHWKDEEIGGHIPRKELALGTELGLFKETSLEKVEGFS